MRYCVLFFLYIFAKNGAAEGRLRDAVYPYNHADWYVEEVLEFADRYVEVNKSEAASRENTGIPGSEILFMCLEGGIQSDIATVRFDCSSSVHWAFAQVGVDLGLLILPVQMP